MIALLLTAVLSGAAADRQVLPDPPLIANPDHCREVAERVRSAQAVEARKLGQLPLAHAEFALMRKVEGCMVPVPMKAYAPVLKVVPPLP